MDKGNLRAMDGGTLELWMGEFENHGCRMIESPEWRNPMTMGGGILEPLLE